MPRFPRIQYEDAIYHIIAKGNRAQNIFIDDVDREKFLSYLKEARRKFDLEIFCFALLDNHFHLSLRTRRSNLSEMMQWLGTSYSVFFNLKHKTSGHLFAGRYKSIPVESERYLISLSFYVHLNPVKAGLVKDPRAYRWSSCRAYTGSEAGLAWLSTNAILSLFAHQGKKQRRAYRDALAHSADAARRMDKTLRREFMIGGSEFRKKIFKKFVIREQGSSHNKLSLDAEQIIRTIARHFQCSSVNILHVARGKANIYRDVAIHLIREYTFLQRKEIGDIFGISRWAVGKSLERMRSEIISAEDFGKEIAAIKKLLLI